MNVRQKESVRPIQNSLGRLGAIAAVWGWLWVVALSVVAGPEDVQTEASVLDRWLGGQANVRTWSAELIQTRTFKTLAQSLKTPGHVWFEAPGRFRWQLDEPPKTIAVRSGDQLRILYPVLQRIEEVDLNDASTGPWREAMILFEAGFPASRKDLEKRFEIRSQIDVNELHRVTLRPRTASARRWLRELVIELGRDDLTLRGTRLEFADGSTLHNEFREIRVNEPQDETLYRPTFTEVEVRVEERVESGKVLP